METSVEDNFFDDLQFNIDIDTKDSDNFSVDFLNDENYFTELFSKKLTDIKDDFLNLEKISNKVILKSNFQINKKEFLKTVDNIQEIDKSNSLTVWSNPIIQIEIESIDCLICKIESLISEEYREIDNSRAIIVLPEKDLGVENKFGNMNAVQREDYLNCILTSLQKIKKASEFSSNLSVEFDKLCKSFDEFIENSPTYKFFSDAVSRKISKLITEIKESIEEDSIMTDVVSEQQNPVHFNSDVESLSELEINMHLDSFIRVLEIVESNKENENFDKFECLRKLQLNFELFLKNVNFKDSEIKKKITTVKKSFTKQIFDQ
jgi:hypothetical protein